MSNIRATKGLKDQTYRMLKERLIECVYPPGSLINESQLASELQLSRTPIREALSKLEMEGFVQIIPKKGIYVTNISSNDVIQIFQARLEIEPIALKLAAPYLPKDELLAFYNKFSNHTTDFQNGFRLDSAMHLFIIEHCGNKYIIDTMRRVFEANTRIIISSKQNQRHIHDAQNEHLEILDLLINDKYEEAATAMRVHIEKCREAALNFFLNNPILPFTSNSAYKNEMRKLGL